jgi:hypothetical protein
LSIVPKPAPTTRLSPVRRFEIAVLRPLQLTLLGGTVVTFLRARWWWFGAGLISLLYLGTIGSKLHPMQSTSDLFQGPLKSRVAIREGSLFPADTQRCLVSSACTRVGILVGAAMFLALLALHWRWYSAGPVSLIGLVAVGAVLKVIFKVVG